MGKQKLTILSLGEFLLFNIRRHACENKEWQSPTTFVENV